MRVEALDELDLLATSLNDEEMTRTALLRRIQFAREIEDHPTHHAALLRLRGLVAYDQSRWRGILHIEECIDAYESGDLDQSYAAAGSALAAYREAGWSDFDEKAAPYTNDEMLAERTRYVR